MYERLTQCGVVALFLVAFALPASAASLIDNGGFEDWDGTQTVSHPSGAYDGASTSQWNSVWSDFKTYSAVNEPVAWLRSEERNLESGGPAGIVDYTVSENTTGFKNNDFLPSEGVSAWNVFGNIDVKSSYFETEDVGAGTFDSPQDDRISLDLTCTRGGGVQQSFNVIGGQTYKVQFDMSVNMYGNAGPRPMVVQVGQGQKSVYQDGQTQVYGNFVPLALDDYSGVQVLDHDADVDPDVNVWNALTEEGGSEGTRVAYSTIALNDTDAENASGTTVIKDGWGNNESFGEGILARDADALLPTANDGLTGLVFWFDWKGSLSGQPSIPTGAGGGDEADWTTVEFSFYADPEVFGEEGVANLSFLSIEGGLDASPNQGPALDDVVVTPEPTAMLILAGGGLALLKRRCRKA
jgi:hypothetical protein